MELLIDIRLSFYSTDHLLIPSVKNGLLQTLPVIVHILLPHNLTPPSQVTHHALHHQVILIEVDLQVIRLNPGLCLHIILAPIRDLPSHPLAIHHHLISNQDQKIQGTSMSRRVEL